MVGECEDAIEETKIIKRAACARCKQSPPPVRPRGPTDMSLSYGRLLLRNKISHYKK
jgi:hypothetical protein